MAIACDAQSLMALAQCINTCIPPGMQFQVLVSVMCQIANNPGGGGSGSVFSGTGNPNGVVTATEPAVYYDKNTGILYQKTGGGNTGWN